MILLLVILSSPLACYLIPVGQNMFFITLFSKTLSLYSSLIDQVSNPYKTTGQNIIDEVKQSTLKAGCFISQETALYAY
jgi:hypothetical protein